MPLVGTSEKPVTRGCQRRLPGALLLAFVLLAGCSKLRPLDTRPLEQAGMSYTTVRRLEQMNLTQTEVTEFALARSAGLSDPACLELLRLARSRSRPFLAGDAVARLARAEISEPSILELARLDQLGLWVGEVEWMRLAGISEETILVLARRRAQGLPVMSGGSLARLKNAGMSEAAVRELVRRGVNDNEAKIAFAQRRRGVRESGILRHFPGRR